MEDYREGTEVLFRVGGIETCLGVLVQDEIQRGPAWKWVTVGWWVGHERSGVCYQMETVVTRNVYLYDKELESYKK